MKFTNVAAIIALLSIGACAATELAGADAGTGVTPTAGGVTSGATTPAPAPGDDAAAKAAAEKKAKEDADKAAADKAAADKAALEAKKEKENTEVASALAILKNTDEKKAKADIEELKLSADKVTALMALYAEKDKETAEFSAKIKAILFPPVAAESIFSTFNICMGVLGVGVLGAIGYATYHFTQKKGEETDL